MQHQLERIIQELEHAEARLAELERSVPGDRWSTRVDPDRWSVSECVVHLNLTSAAYIPRIRTAIEEAGKLPRSDGRKYRRDPAGWFLSTMIGPLPSIAGRRFGRVKTTADFVPDGDQHPTVAVAAFKGCQAELIALARDADALAIDKVSILSPFGNRMRYNCWSAFVILPRHQERHLQQAETVWADE